MRVLLLVGCAKDLAYAQDVGLVGVAVGFVVERLGRRQGKGMLVAGKETAIGGEEVGELERSD
jgi:hypothetical protein